MPKTKVNRTRTARVTKKNNYKIIGKLRNFKPVFFIFIFAVVGVSALLLTGAKGDIPTGNNEVVFLYETVTPALTAKDSNNQIVSDYQPINVRLTGDGELLCEDGTNISLTAGKLNGMQIEKLYEDIKNLGINNLPDEIDVSQSSTRVSEYKRIVVGNNDRDKQVIIYPGADVPSEFTHAITRLKKECTTANKKIRSTEVRGVKPIKKNKKSTLSLKAIKDYLVKTASATDYYGYSQAQEDDQFNRTNSHRAGHGINSLTRSGCLTNAAREWAKTMGDQGQLYHSNMGELIKRNCGVDFSNTGMRTMGENVGYGFSSETIFNAYLNSPCHHAGIDSRKFSSPPCSVTGAVNTNPYDLIGVGYYTNDRGQNYTATLFVYCPGSTCGAFRTAVSPAPSPVAATYYRSGWANNSGGKISLDWYGRTKAYNLGSASGPNFGIAIARDIELNPSSTQGYVLDGYGGMHPLAIGTNAKPQGVSGGGYWSGWDIARDIAIYDWTNMRGYKLDGWGGLNSINGAPAASGGGYWKGWDIARKITLLPNGVGGYQLDGFGGVHGFRTGSNPQPPNAKVSAFWNGWDIARDITVNPNGTGGYVLDGFGGIHPFSTGSNTMPATIKSPYYPGKDVLTNIRITDWSTMRGYVLDKYGNFYGFNGAP